MAVPIHALNELTAVCPVLPDRPGKENVDVRLQICHSEYHDYSDDYEA